MAEKEYTEVLGILTESGIFQEVDFPIKNGSIESRVRRGELAIVARNADGSTQPVDTMLVVWVDGEPEEYDPKDERHDAIRQREGSMIPAELFDTLAEDSEVESPTEPPTREKNSKGGKAKGKKASTEETEED